MSSRPGSSQTYRYLQCFGPGLLQNIAICKLLRSRCSQTRSFTQHLLSHTGLAVNLVEIRLQPQVLLFTMFWARAAPKHRYLHAFGRPVLPKQDYLRNICLSYCQVIASSLDAVFDSVALFVEFALGVLFVAHVPASQFEYGVRTSHY